MLPVGVVFRCSYLWLSPYGMCALLKGKKNGADGSGLVNRIVRHRCLFETCDPSLGRRCANAIDFACRCVVRYGKRRADSMP